MCDAAEPASQAPLARAESDGSNPCRSGTGLHWPTLAYLAGTIESQGSDTLQSSENNWPFREKQQTML